MNLYTMPKHRLCAKATQEEYTLKNPLKEIGNSTLGRK